MIQPPLPERVGPYRIVRELGRGGMGVVYEARRDGLDRRLVLKVVLASATSPEALLRFQREAELMARVRHPSVVAIHELLTTPRGPVIVCDLVEGEPLSRKVKAGWRDDRAAARLVLQLADAVHALHQASIVHRDLKPDNVIVRPDGTPVLLDFGVARDQAAQRMTVTGALLGSPHYMAPEQANGELPRTAGSAIGPATDVYGLGAILFELLAGRPPFDDSRSLQDCLFRVVSGDPPRWPSATRPDVSRDLEAIVRRAMAPQPADRYPSARALQDDLARVLAGARGEGLVRPDARPWATLGAGAALVVVAVLLVTSLLRGETRAPADLAPSLGPVASASPAPAAVAVVATQEPGWRALARALTPGQKLPARGPTLLATIPQRARLRAGPRVWSIGPEQLVTEGVGPDGAALVLVRSLRAPAVVEPARHGDARLIPGSLFALERGTALLELARDTLAPGRRTALPIALHLAGPVAARADPEGALLAGVEAARPLEVVVLRLLPDGEVVRLPTRVQPPEAATGVSLLLLGPPGRLIVGYRRAPSPEQREGARVERGEVVSLLVETTAGVGAPERLVLDARPTALALSDDGHLLCVGTSFGQVYLSAADRLAPLPEGLLDSRLPWDALCFRAQGQPGPHAHTGWVTGVAFARDGGLYTSSCEQDLTVPSELRRWALASPPRSSLVHRETPDGADGPTQLHALSLAAEGCLLLASTGSSTRSERASPADATGPCAVEVWLVAEPP